MRPSRAGSIASLCGMVDSGSFPEGMDSVAGDNVPGCWLISFDQGPWRGRIQFRNSDESGRFDPFRVGVGSASLTGDDVPGY